MNAAPYIQYLIGQAKARAQGTSHKAGLHVHQQCTNAVRHRVQSSNVLIAAFVQLD
jgi:hypothetical protein